MVVVVVLVVVAAVVVVWRLVVVRGGRVVRGAVLGGLVAGGAGATGPAGATTVTTRFSGLVVRPSGGGTGTIQATASCLAGETATGGGFSIGNSGINDDDQVRYSNREGQAHRVIVDDWAGDGAEVRAHVNCASP